MMFYENYRSNQECYGAERCNSGGSVFKAWRKTANHVNENDPRKREHRQGKRNAPGDGLQDSYHAARGEDTGRRI